MKTINSILIFLTLITSSIFSQDEEVEIKISRSFTSYNLGDWSSFNGYEFSVGLIGQLGISEPHLGFYLSYKYETSNKAKDFFDIRHQSGNEELDTDTALYGNSKAHTISLNSVHFFYEEGRIFSPYFKSSISMSRIYTRINNRDTFEPVCGYELKNDITKSDRLTLGIGLGSTIILHEKVSLFAEFKIAGSPFNKGITQASFNLNGGIVYTVW